MHSLGLTLRSPEGPACGSYLACVGAGRRLA
jgi:hypothetical protein